MIDRDWKVIYSRMDGCVITAKKKVAAELLQQKWFPFGKKNWWKACLPSLQDKTKTQDRTLHWKFLPHENYGDWCPCSTLPRPSEKSEKNWSTQAKSFLTSHLWHKAILKVWKKSWEPFRIYQLTSTANSAHFHPNWAGLAVLFSRQLLNGSQDLFFVLIL